MKFRTEITIPCQPDFISYKSDMLSIGSCFADEMGERLRQLEFNISVNPLGVIFNPVSIADVLKSALTNQIQDNHFVERDGSFFHYGYHSRINADSKSELNQKLNMLNSDCAVKLKEGNLLIITFGTAWAYRLIQSNQVVANCHKIPQKEFTKELLDLNFLKASYRELFADLFENNPKLKILLTVSPVRHIKDGVHENNLSKSILLLLSDFLVKQFDRVNYFPSYELIVDDLRDYRFYKEDLIHPTRQAVDYVFEKFSDAYFNEQTKKGVTTQQGILKLEAHRKFTNKK